MPGRLFSADASGDMIKPAYRFGALKTAKGAISMTEDRPESQPSLITAINPLVIILFGQFVSLIGTGLTSFGLGVWVYNNTGSATKFALTFLFSTLPAILFHRQSSAQTLNTTGMRKAWFSAFRW